MNDNDLISRSAAIEALGERPYNWTDSEAEIAEVCAWENHKSAIENVPAIYAIPVEWLEEQRDKLSEAWDEEWYVINGLIEQWQEEQEAR